MRFYAAPDEFVIWETPKGTYTMDINANSEPAGGRTNITFRFRSATTKVLMLIASITQTFSMSEVEFHTCPGKCMSNKILWSTLSTFLSS